MNYIKIYKNLIDKRIKTPSNNNYTEKHHIIPRCMGGSDDSTNLVLLSLREHYVAHLLLAKIHSNVPGLQYALFLFSSVSSSMYEYNRIKVIELLKNREVTEETKKLMSLSQKKRFSNQNSSDYLTGRHLSYSTRKLISSKRIKFCENKNNVNIMLNNLKRGREINGPSMLNKNHSDESKKKMINSWRKKGKPIIRHDGTNFIRYEYPSDAVRDMTITSSNICQCAKKNLIENNKPPNMSLGFYWLYDTPEAKRIFINRLKETHERSKITSY